MNKTVKLAWSGICLKCKKQFRSPCSTREEMEFHCSQCDECWNRTVESHTSKLIGKVLTEKELRDASGYWTNTQDWGRVPRAEFN